jgi:3-hydroxybutyryl-CoA dehydratase
MTLPSQLIERRLRVDSAAIRLYAGITQDYNPIHLDRDFAAKTAMGGIIAHGMLSLSLVWQSLAATFGSDQLSNVALDIRFVRPVRENDLVVAGGARTDGQNGYDIWVKTEGKEGFETVISGTVKFNASVS